MVNLHGALILKKYIDTDKEVKYVLLTAKIIIPWYAYTSKSLVKKLTAFIGKHIAVKISPGYMKYTHIQTSGLPIEQPTSSIDNKINNKIDNEINNETNNETNKEKEKLLNTSLDSRHTVHISRNVADAIKKDKEKKDKKGKEKEKDKKKDKKKT